MDLQLSAAHLRFRNELRAWLAATLPRPWREELRDPRATETSLIELRRAWQKKLYQAGYLGMDWPEQWGGRGGTEVEKSIMEAELARADAPPILNILGIGLLGPALIHHGSEAQRRRFIPPMLSGDEIWCQGFSEPGAGSDLASLNTAARVEGDHFLLNGQKVWTTFGPWADWIFVLARTDATDRYGGISFILTKLATPGITVRPLRQITGESEFGEVFFENARVPTENVVGKVPGPESSIEKIYWSEFDKRFRETALDLLGPGGQLLRLSPHARPDVDWAREFLWSRAGTIYSGSSEVQRNIIAKRVLNLPQDAR